MARARRKTSQSTPAVVAETARPMLPPVREIVYGLRLHVSGKELAARLAERIRWHRERGDLLIEQMKRLGEVEREATDELSKALTTGYDSPRRLIEKELRQHQERASFLAFLRDHVAADETYRLDSSDLRMTEILPDKPW